MIIYMDMVYYKRLFTSVNEKERHLSITTNEKSPIGQKSLSALVQCPHIFYTEPENRLKNHKNLPKTTVLSMKTHNVHLHKLIFGRGSLNASIRKHRPRFHLILSIMG